MIKIKNLTYCYKGSERKILDGMSTEFHPGTLHVILGKNGNGKTTMFDLITNIIKRPKEILGVPNTREIIYQQQGLLFPTILKGKDLFRFFLYTDYNNQIKVNKEPYSDDYMSSSEVDLVKRIWDMRYGQMSIGERRYLSILAFTLMKRKLYIFDEPTSGVDPDTRVRVVKRIENLLSRPEVIVLLSTHTLHEFENINCKLHLLHEGNMKFEGSYNQFIHMSKTNNPDHAFSHKVQ